MAWVIYSIDNNIKFTRNKEAFEYKYLNKTKKFYPDFLLEDGTLVEIKGYKTSEYLAKLNDFPKNRNLITLYKNEMKFYLDYATAKYGKNFVDVYEK